MQKNLRSHEILWKLMRLTLLQAAFSIAGIAMTYAMDGYGQGLLDRKVTVHARQEQISEVLEKLQKTANVTFVYSYELIEADRKVDIDITQKKLKIVLDELLLTRGIAYEVSNDKSIILRRDQTEKVRAVPPEIISIKISGKIVDDLNQPLPGVNVLEKGTLNGTTSNADGIYSIEVENENSVLVFSFIGFVTQDIEVGSRQDISIALLPDITSLEEIVVVGYGTQKRSDLTGSIAQVKSDEINSFPTTNIMQALSGRAPGVQVLQTTGAPGAGLSVRIRGTNSIYGGNEPLYVIDGFPYSGNPTNLNNSDIESIEILKDASATAIYGSRGANGVVMITTKQGIAGKTTVEFESSYSIQKLQKKLDLMNGTEYATMANLQATNDNIAPYFTQQEVDGFGEGFDWQDLVFQEAPMMTNSLSINGGNDKTRVSVGGSIFGQDGIVKGSDYNRYSIRANIAHKISKKFSVNITNSLSFLETGRKDSNGGSRGGSMINSAIGAAPISTPYNDDGTLTVLANQYPFVPTDVINPLNFINEQSITTKANVILSNAALLFNPIPEITIKVSGGIENRDERTDSYTSREFVNSNGSAAVSTLQFRSLLSENTISYVKTFNTNHSISAIAGFTYQDFLSTSLGASGVGFLSDVFETYDLSAAATPGIPSSGYSKSVIMSYLGRLNYTLNNKYLFTLSFRSDGSSRYTEGSKWGYFPSGAVAWRLHEEEFFNAGNIFSDFKVRASWGLTGSQAISPYSTLNLLRSGLTVFDNTLYNSFAPTSTLPGDLKWETTEQIDFGLDLGFLDNRVQVTADYYIKNTSDLLNTVTLPSSTGYISTIRNVGEVQNKGFELGVDGKILTGPFKWNMNGNISFNKNKVIKLQDGEDIFGGNINVLAVNDNVTILREGRPIGQFYGYLENGYNDQGQIVIRDLNEDGLINAEDKTYIGDPNPDFIYGINSNMSYKNFELTLFIQGTYGNDIYNVSAIPTTIDYGQGVNMPREVFLDHWTPENTDAKYPKISRSTSAYNSDRWIEDGSFLRLRNIQLAYNFPVGRVPWLQSAQLYVSGQNLITLTKYSWWDPEVNSRGAGTAQGIDHFTYPMAKSFTAGFRVGF